MLIFLSNCNSVTFSTCSTKSRSLPQLTRYEPCTDLYKISDKEVHYKKRRFSGCWQKSQSCRSNQTWTWWKIPTRIAWYMWTVMDSDWGGGRALDLWPPHLQQHRGEAGSQKQAGIRPLRRHGTSEQNELVRWKTHCRTFASQAPRRGCKMEASRRNKRLCSNWSDLPAVLPLTFLSPPSTWMTPVTCDSAGGPAEGLAWGFSSTIPHAWSAVDAHPKLSFESHYSHVKGTDDSWKKKKKTCSTSGS